MHPVCDFTNLLDYVYVLPKKNKINRYKYFDLLSYALEKKLQYSIILKYLTKMFCAFLFLNCINENLYKVFLE